MWVFISLGGWEVGWASAKEARQVTNSLKGRGGAGENAVKRPDQTPTRTAQRIPRTRTPTPNAARDHFRTSTTGAGDSTLLGTRATFVPSGRPRYHSRRKARRTAGGRVRSWSRGAEPPHLNFNTRNHADARPPKPITPQCEWSCVGTTERENPQTQKCSRKTCQEVEEQACPRRPQRTDLEDIPVSDST